MRIISCCYSLENNENDTSSKIEKIILSNQDLFIEHFTQSSESKRIAWHTSADACLPDWKRGHSECAGCGGR